MKKKNKLSVKNNLKKASEASDFLVKNKNLLIVLGVGITGFVVYKSLTNVGNSVKDALDAGETDQIVVEILPNESNVTLTDSEADLLAKALLEAFNDESSYFGGTDEEKIAEVLEKIQNSDDYLKVYNAFSYRPWMQGGTPETYVDKKFLSEDKDLNHWFKSELNSYFDSEIYEKVKALVEGAGMIF